MTGPKDEIRWKEISKRFFFTQRSMYFYLQELLRPMYTVISILHQFSAINSMVKILPRPRKANSNVLYLSNNNHFVILFYCNPLPHSHKEKHFLCNSWNFKYAKNERDNKLQDREGKKICKICIWGSWNTGLIKN